MKEQYDVRLWLDNQYGIHKKGEFGIPIFIGTLQEVNAWLDLKEKGFDL